MDRHIPVVVSAGEPFARGFHLGRSEARRVTQSVTAYMAIFRLFTGLRREGVLAEAECFMPVIAGYAPHLLEEMRGIAEGAGRDVREIVAINVRTELMYGLGILRKGRTSECTSVAIGKSASADGHVRVAQNWDWIPSLAGTLVLWVIQRDDGPNLLTLVEAGMVGKIGINAAGLAMCVNLLISDSDHAGPAVPMHIILRRVLEEASSVEEAISLIGASKRCTSCNHLLADRGGALASVEATPTAQAVLRPTGDVLTHTNHCFDADLAVYDRNARESPETLARGRRIQALAQRERGKRQESLINEKDLRVMLADHGSESGSICLHVRSELPFVEQGESIASIIFDLTEGQVDIADGPPCQYSYRRFPLSEYLRHYE